MAVYKVYNGSVFSGTVVTDGVTFEHAIHACLAGSKGLASSPEDFERMHDLLRSGGGLFESVSCFAHGRNAGRPVAHFWVTRSAAAVAREEAAREDRERMRAEFDAREMREMRSRIAADRSRFAALSSEDRIVERAQGGGYDDLMTAAELRDLRHRNCFGDRI